MLKEPTGFLISPDYFRVIPHYDAPPKDFTIKAGVFRICPNSSSECWTYDGRRYVGDAYVSAADFDEARLRFSIPSYIPRFLWRSKS